MLLSTGVGVATTAGATKLRRVIKDRILRCMFKLSVALGVAIFLVKRLEDDFVSLKR